MKIDEHLTKARRIEKTMVTKLDRNNDYELYVECYMLAGTHLLNAVLHKLAITPQVSDLLHSDKPPLNRPVDAGLRPMFDAMKFIEGLRPGYLRGKAVWRPEDGEKCEQSYQQVKRLAQQFIG
jgi:hypothetical protein